MKFLTLAMVKTLLAMIGCTITHKYGEYCVRIKGSPAGHGYFTTELGDALSTAVAMRHPQRK